MAPEKVPLSSELQSPAQHGELCVGSADTITPIGAEVRQGPPPADQIATARSFILVAFIVAASINSRPAKARLEPTQLRLHRALERTDANQNSENQLDAGGRIDRRNVRKTPL